MMYTERDICAALLEEMGRPGGSGLLTYEGPISIYADGLANHRYEDSGPIELIVRGLSITKDAGVYSRDCFEGCYLSNGIWSTAVNIREKPLLTGVYQGCFEDDVYDDSCEPPCVETHIEYKESCFDEGVFSPDCFVKEPYLTGKVTEFRGCDEPAPLISYEALGEPVIYGNHIGTVYEFEGEIPLYIDVYTEDVFSPVSPEPKIMVLEASVYEDGVYGDDCFERVKHLYSYAPYTVCWDSCVASEWKWEGYKDCLSFHYPQPYRYPFRTFVERPYCSLCWEPFLWLQWYLPPIEDGVYEEDVYTSWMNIGHSPLQLFPQYTSLYNFPINWDYIHSFPYQEINPGSSPIILHGDYLDCEDVTPSSPSILSRICNQCLPSYEMTEKGEYLGRPVNDSWEFYIEGAGTDEYVYVADIGYLHPLCGEPMIVEPWVPLDIYGRVKGSTVLPKDVHKIVIVYQVDRRGATPILHFIGSPALLRSEYGALLTGSEEIPLLPLSQSLCHLILSDYWRAGKCTRVSHERWLHPPLRTVVEDNLSLLSNLWREGIPALLPLLGEPETIYDEERYVDEEVPLYKGVYSNPCSDIWSDTLIIDDALFPSYCATSTCYGDYRKRRLSNRNIDIEAIAWMLYAFVLYREVTSSKKYDLHIKRVADYICSLISNGRVDRTILIGSEWGQEINGEVYDLQTHQAVSMALLKTYDVLPDPKYLSIATDVDEHIHTYFYDGSAYVGEAYPSIGWGLIRNRVEAVEAAISKLGLTITHPSSMYLADLFIGENVPLLADRGCLLQARGDVSRDMHPLLISALKGASEDYYTVPYLETALLYQKEVGLHTSALEASICLLSSPIWTHKGFITDSVPDMEMMIYGRGYIPSQLAILLPINFGWFSEEALKKGNMAALIKGLSQAISPYNPIRERRVRGTYLSEADGIYLDQWGRDLSEPRLLNERDDDYRRRLKVLLKNRGSSAPDIESYFKALDYEAEVKNVDILTTVSNRYIPYHHQPYLSAPLIGDKSRAGMFHVFLEDIAPERVLRRMEEAAGTIPLIQETLDLTCPDEDNEEVLLESGQVAPPSIFYCCTSSCNIAMKITFETDTPLYLNLEGVYEEARPDSVLIRPNQSIHFVKLATHDFSNDNDGRRSLDEAIASLESALLHRNLSSQLGYSTRT